jgi:multidrug efflux pump subunit AcrB
MSQNSAPPKSLNIVHLSMRRPISVIVLVVATVLASIFAITELPRDILPSLGVPIIYVAQPYGGMSPAQMESYLTYYYEYHFLYISGIEHVESKNIESIALIKLQFHPGTDMAQALAETINYVNRAKAFMPEGVVPPFVMRFDAGSEPVGKLVFTSQDKSRTLGQLQNLALNFVRPLFATLPGVSAPPPFGASQRTVVITIDPQKLRKFNLSPNDVAQSISKANKIIPSGNIQVGDTYPLIPLNSVVKDIHELEDVPLRTGTYPTVFLRDVGKVQDGADIQTGYALVNGQRTVYIPVTKRADASTLSVVDLVQKNLPRFQSVLPDDVKVSYEFDQSGYVRRSITSLLFEGAIGAILTGLMVLLFLQSWRSAVIVVLNIPIALFSAVLALWITKQTVNMMTLGGLALAVGILVDEATVTIENIHNHLARGKKLAEAALDGTNEILKPALLTMLCILSVFIPSFFMNGVARALFVPLTLAVGFSIIGSFILSRTLVPVLVTWLLAKGEVEYSSDRAFAKFRDWYGNRLAGIFRIKKTVIAFYLLTTIGLVIILVSHLGREIFPQVDVGQFQLRLRAPTGSTIEKTEALTLKALEIMKAEAGPDNLESSVGFVGAQTPNYPINVIYLWSAGSHEAVLEVALRRGSGISVLDLQERLRHRFANELPQVRFSFEASSLVDRIMSMGSSTPIEVTLNGQNLPAVREYSKKIEDSLRSLPYLRDLQTVQDFDYPAIEVSSDRRKAGLMGLTIADIGQALVPATSSSRFILQNYWSDPKNGINYQVQVEVPQGTLQSIEDIKNLPVSVGGGAILLDKFSEVKATTVVGEYDRYNMQRMVTLHANLSGMDLGHAAKDISNILSPLERERPKGIELHVRGQIASLLDMFRGLAMGLALAVVVIFLLLAANFESLTLAVVILSTVPATLLGVGLSLFLTGTTLNIESFIGAIMAIGVAVSNAILLVTFAERDRLTSGDAVAASIHGAQSRLRPVLMTSFAMIAGMIPMAIGIGEGSGQTTPLARAVIGGLTVATLSTLTVLPLIYAVIQNKRTTKSASLDPDDPESANFRGARV